MNLWYLSNYREAVLLKIISRSMRRTVTKRDSNFFLYENLNLEVISEGKI